jgi:hypothetical protein
LAGAAYTSHIEARRVATAKVTAAESDAPPRRRLPRAARGITLSAIGGIVLGLFFPLLSYGAWAEPATSPYGTALLFGGVSLQSFFHEFSNSRTTGGVQGLLQGREA